MREAKLRQQQDGERERYRRQAIIVLEKMRERLKAHEKDQKYASCAEFAPIDYLVRHCPLFMSKGQMLAYCWQRKHQRIRANSTKFWETTTLTVVNMATLNVNRADVLKSHRIGVFDDVAN